MPKLNSPEQNKSFHEEAQAHQTKAEAHQAKAHAQDPGQHQVPPEQFAEVSAILIQHLANTEEHLVRIKERIDFAKVILDELLFKMDSISKIMEIVRANEVKSASLAEAQAVSYKTSKDSIDEFLELLQGPVFQKLLRQFFVKFSWGTGTAEERIWGDLHRIKQERSRQRARVVIQSTEKGDAWMANAMGKSFSSTLPTAKRSGKN